nr:MAG TPA: hypothetical protein [Caudoviricetes sp.]
MTHALPALNPAISPVWHMLQMWRVLHLSISAASWAVYVRIISCSRYLPPPRGRCSSRDMAWTVFFFLSRLTA